MRYVGAAVLLVAVSGCVFSPEGEDEERHRARAAWPGEAPPSLPDTPSLEEVLKHAYLSNAGLKERWWAWMAALDQVPQDASQPTTLALTYSQMFESGRTSWSQATFGVTNDPMANFVWPGKLRTAGRRALELAKAEGFRFDAARLDLRARVVKAWYEVLVSRDSIRILERDLAYLESIVDASDARVRTGGAPQQDLLKARGQRDLSQNRLETARSKYRGRLANLNALLNREPTTPLALPREWPAARTLTESDADIVARLADRNPELEALARTVESRQESETLMRQQYIPDFSLAFSGDAGGIARSMMAMVTAPVFRYAAIEAAISQARSELEMTRSLRTQEGYDLKARAVLLLYDIRSAERQWETYESRILPLAEQGADSARSAYIAGRLPAFEMIDARRMQLEARLMSLELKAERETALAELEALVGGPSEGTRQD